MEKLKLTVPSVHLNGTSFAGLHDPLVRAGSDIRAAIEALSECAPHGRDYYVQDDRAFAKSRDEHLSRVSRLQSVLDELKVLARQVQKAQDIRLETSAVWAAVRRP